METLISKKNYIELHSWKNKKLKIVLFDLKHVNEALIAHDAKPVDGIIGADILKKSKAIQKQVGNYRFLSTSSLCNLTENITPTACPEAPG